MKKILLAVAFLAASTTTLLAATPQQPLKWEKMKLREQFSYIMGAQLARMATSESGLDSADYNSDLVAQGFIDQMHNRNISGLNEHLSEALMEQYQDTIAQINLTRSEKWLAQQTQQAGVQMLGEGIWYRILNEGNPDIRIQSADDDISIRFRLMGMNGYVIDSSVRAMDLPIRRTTSAMDHDVLEALQLIGQGGEMEMWFHPDEAYEDNGRDGVGPNSAIYLKISVSKINWHLRSTSDYLEEDLSIEELQEHIKEVQQRIKEMKRESGGRRGRATEIVSISEY